MDNNFKVDAYQNCFEEKYFPPNLSYDISHIQTSLILNVIISDQPQLAQQVFHRPHHHILHRLQHTKVF